MNERNETAITFAGRPGAFPAYSYFDVLAGDSRRVNPRDFAGRFVVVGVTAMGLADLHATPFSRWGAGSMTGLEVEATMLNMVLAGRVRRIAPSTWVLVAGTLLVIPWGYWLGAQTASTRLITSGIVLAASALAWIVLLAGFQLYCDPTAPWLSIAAIPAGLTYWETRSVNRMTHRQAIRLNHIPAGRPSSDPVEQRIVRGITSLFQPAGVLLYAGRPPRLVATDGNVEAPPARLPRDAVISGQWPASERGPVAGETAIVYRPVLPLQSGDEQPHGYLVLFFPVGHRDIVPDGATYRLAAAAIHLLAAYAEQSAALLWGPRFRPGRDASAPARPRCLGPGRDLAAVESAVGNPVRCADGHLAAHR